MAELGAERRYSYERHQFEIMPGDVAWGLAGDEFRVLLGSCVSLILTDPHRTVATICHIVHEGRTPGLAEGDPAWGDAALGWMCRTMGQRGFAPGQCVAYVYGGGNMFAQLKIARPVGERNVAWTFQALADLGIRVLEQSVGGAGYRVVKWTVGPDHPEVSFVPV